MAKKKDHEKLKRIARNNPGLSTRSTLTAIAEGKNEFELANLPSQSSMKRLVTRTKQEILNDPKNPSERIGFEIDEKYTQYCGEFFLRCDTGEDDPNRILIFLTDDGIQDLLRYLHWSMDGTFRSRPKSSQTREAMFAQVLTIHVHFNETQTAARYAFGKFI